MFNVREPIGTLFFVFVPINVLFLPFSFTYNVSYIHSNGI